MKSSMSLRTSMLAVLGLIAGAASSHAQDSVGTTFGALGWAQYNLIGHSSLADGAYDGKNVFNTGAQLSLTRRASERLVVKAGVGVFTDNAIPRANAGYSSNSYSLSNTNPYVYEADFTYTLHKSEESDYWVRAGIFPYTYAPDVKNLGLYLMRGPVYPGILLSGYERQGMMPVANMAGRPVATMTGIQQHHQWRELSGDLIVSTETQFYPFFDLSFAYIAAYQPHSSLRVGAGVNFYHAVHVDNELYEGLEVKYNGTKLMANFAFDPKKVMDLALPFGPEDLKLYGEIGLIGLDNDSTHEAIYGGYADRIPVMLGFNIPTFNYLDYLSIEVEWYGAQFEDDLSRYNKGTFSPAPVVSSDPYGKRDNWKWSLQGERTLQKHVTLSLTLANDHYRPGIYRGYTDGEMPDRTSFMVTSKDWYTASKISFFF